MGSKLRSRSGGEPGNEPEIDGRARIREQNRSLIEEACYKLLKAGKLLPTADDVAELSGVGRRTVFRQFRNMEGLIRSVEARVYAEFAPFLAESVESPDLESALESLANRRARLHDFSTPFRRAGALMRSESAFVREREASGEALLRSRLEEAIAPHIVDPDGVVMDGLELIFSFEAWDRLRTRQGLSQQRAKEATLRAALALASTARRVKKPSSDPKR